MTPTRDEVFEAHTMLVDLGIAEDDSRDFLRDQVGVDPISPVRATAQVTLILTITLDETALEDLEVDDVEDAMRDAASDVVYDSGHTDFTVDDVSGIEVEMTNGDVEAP